MGKKVRKAKEKDEQESNNLDNLAWVIPGDKEKSVYRFIIAAAKRARQLQAGARPLISTTYRKPSKIAMEEIRGGEVAVEVSPQDEPATNDGPASE